MKRQRILVGLVTTAFLTLVVATWTGMVAWLWLTIGLDVAFASYVTLLLHTKQQRSVARATVVPIDSAQPVASGVLTAVPEYEETLTVRVIAG
ncbi:MAG: hypothetical protein V3S28_07740 [Acidimicrobiia bacterium]|jgi:hypothetical protein